MNHASNASALSTMSATIHPVVFEELRGAGSRAGGGSGMLAAGIGAYDAGGCATAV